MIHYHTVFPSLIIEKQLTSFESIQSSLIDWIYSYADSHEGVHYSNVGGYQSKSDFWMDESFSPYLNYFRQEIESMVECYDSYLTLKNAWFNINRKGDYNRLHVHPRSLLSAVLWVKSPEQCGGLMFPNDQYLRTNWEMFIKPEYKDRLPVDRDHRFQPKEGTMVIFPSYLYHEVESNQTNQDRISIAFNLTD